MVYIQVFPKDLDANRSMQSVSKSECLLPLCHFLKESLKDLVGLWNSGQLSQNTTKPINRLIKSLPNTTEGKQQLK